MSKFLNKKCDFTTLPEDQYESIYKDTFILTEDLHVLLQLYSKLLDSMEYARKFGVVSSVEKKLCELKISEVTFDKGHIKSMIQCYIKLKDINSAVRLVKNYPDVGISSYITIMNYFLDNDLCVDDFIEKKVMALPMTSEHYHDLVIRGRPMLSKMVKDLITIDDKLFKTISANITHEIVPTVLHSYNLDSTQQDEIQKAIDNYFSRTKLSKKQRENFEYFKRYISINNIDIIIDGANVGYFDNKGNINYSNIINLAQQFLGRKVLIVLNKRHEKDFSKLCYSEHFQIQPFLTYYSERGLYDDMFWLYASITLNIPVITNDKLSNIKSKIGFDVLLQHLETYKFIKLDKFGLIFPPNVMHNDGKYVYLPGEDYTIKIKL